jgi:hypothetical protein
MGLETALYDLKERLSQLHETVSALHVFIMDHPPGDETILVERLEEKATDVLSLVEEATATLRELLQSGNLAGRARATRTVLLSVHQHAVQVAQKHRDELLAYENIYSLLQLSSERGCEWPSWSSVVKEAIEGCTVLLDAVHEAIRICWREGTGEALMIGASNQISCRAETGRSISAATLLKGTDS